MTGTVNQSVFKEDLLFFMKLIFRCDLPLGVLVLGKLVTYLCKKFHYPYTLQLESWV